MNYLRSTVALSGCAAIFALMGCGGGSGYSGGGGSNSGGSGGSNSGGSNTPFTLSGTLSGLGTGQSVNLQDNGGDTLALDANGTFSFPLTNLSIGNSFSVTLKSHTPGIRCLVTAGNGTVGATTLAPVNVACGAGTEAVESFGAIGADGQNPNGGVILLGGNLYGTTSLGGANGAGAVFTINSSGAESVLYSFGASNTDGQTPNAGLIADSAGNLYGTTYAGGAGETGTVFKVSATGTETVLHSFNFNPATNHFDGANPSSDLVMDSAGNLYGTTFSGGQNDEGTVFKIDTTGTEFVVYSFGTNSNDGLFPRAGLIADGAGNVYGTTSQGGAHGHGTVFKVSIALSAETTLYSFGASSQDGQGPVAGLVADGSGNFYGTTFAGGANNAGTVFKLAATTVQGSVSYSESVIYSFGASATDGKNPEAGLVFDSAGNLYGTTDAGGANSDGTVFAVTPQGTETVLHSFGASSTDGKFPVAGLTIDSTGNLHGTVSAGGANGFGGVFVID